jgi:hypothetical protein
MNTRRHTQRRSTQTLHCLTLLTIHGEVVVTRIQRGTYKTQRSHRRPCERLQQRGRRQGAKTRKQTNKQTTSNEGTLQWYLQNTAESSSPVCASSTACTTSGCQNTKSPGSTRGIDVIVFKRREWYSSVATCCSPVVAPARRHAGTSLCSARSSMYATPNNADGSTLRVPSPSPCAVNASHPCLKKQTKK